MLVNGEHRIGIYACTYTEISIIFIQKSLDIYSKKNQARRRTIPELRSQILSHYQHGKGGRGTHFTTHYL